MCGVILALLQYTFMSWCLVKKREQGQLYLYRDTQNICRALWYSWTTVVCTTYIGQESHLSMLHPIKLIVASFLLPVILSLRGISDKTKKGRQKQFSHGEDIAVKCKSLGGNLVSSGRLNS
jgi:hypothetical protein